MGALSATRENILDDLHLDPVRSGASAARSASVRLGFLPLALEHLFLDAMAGIPIYLRTAISRDSRPDSQFTLYCAPHVRMTEYHRQRLREAGVRFIYIAMHDHARFRRQIEAHLAQVATNPVVALSAKSELVYETSVELINEVLAEPALADKLPRVEAVARAITTLVLNDGAAFSHLFAASQHDFYTATHMINVAAWMVPLAYAMGISAADQLNHICIAGMLHDIGKLFVPEEILNKRGPLSEDEWQILKAHPVRGALHLAKFDHIPEPVWRVVLEHHERMDASGYPAGLRGDQIHLFSRICAVVDSFDAMTAFRPFKERTLSCAQALHILRAEAGTRYDRDVVAAWIGLLSQSQPAVKAALRPADATSASPGRRAHVRFPIHCPARVHPLTLVGDRWIERQAIPVTAHSISRGGLGFLSRQRFAPAQYVRACLLGPGTLSNRIIDGQIVRCRPYKDGWYDIGLHAITLADERLAVRHAAALTSPPSPLHPPPSPP